MARVMGDKLTEITSEERWQMDNYIAIKMNVAGEFDKFNTPSRGGVTRGPSTSSGSQSVKPSRGGATKSPSSCSGSKPVTSSLGGSTTGRVTQSPATCSGGLPVTSSWGKATPGQSSRSGGQPTTEWQEKPERVDSDLEDLFNDFNQVADSPIECRGGWINPS